MMITLRAVGDDGDDSAEDRKAPTPTTGREGPTLRKRKLSNPQPQEQIKKLKGKRALNYHVCV